MDEKEIRTLADWIVERMLAPHNVDLIAAAIAKELRRLSTAYSTEIDKLGTKLDAGHY